MLATGGGLVFTGDMRGNLYAFDADDGKELWTFADDRIAVRFAYEWRDDSGHWFRSYGNENWEFADNGLMMKRLYPGPDGSGIMPPSPSINHAPMCRYEL